VKDLTPLKSVPSIGTARAGVNLKVLGRIRRPLKMRVHS